MFSNYQRHCRSGELRPGIIHPYRAEDGVLILNFAVKDHWRQASQHAWVEACLQRFVAHAERLELSHVALPALGALNGWIDWSTTLELMQRYLEPCPVDCELVFYRPGLTANVVLNEPVEP